MIVNKHFNEKDAIAMLHHIDGLMSQVQPIRCRGSHEKMRNLPPVLRKHLIETLCPPEGHDQAMLAGKFIPHSFLSEKILARRRCYDYKNFMKRKNLMMKNV